MKPLEWLDLFLKCSAGGMLGFAVGLTLALYRRVEALERDYREITTGYRDLAGAFLTLIRNLRYGPGELLESEQEAWRLFQEWVDEHPDRTQGGER